MNNNKIRTIKQLLKKSVNFHFNCDIDRACRKKRYVNARMTYAYIMRKRGCTLESIARYLSKNHATIIHYLNNIEWYLKTDEEFREKFNIVYEDVYLNHKSVHTLDVEGLISEIFSLRNENKFLHSLSESLKKEQEKYKKDEERFKDIFDIVRQRTHMGSEEKVLKKLNTMYNGIYS